MSIKPILSLLLATALTLPSLLLAEDYVIDTKGAHASINFRIQHLGYSWLTGRFNEFAGDFSYDEKDPSASKVAVTINVASIDSNHAERDKHLRSDEFLDVKKFPEAKFVSTGFTETGDGKAELKGDFTLHGVTKPITIAVEHVGHGDDPWGGYRRGFHGTTSIKLADYGITYNLGPASTQVDLMLEVEGIRK
jgi:polyisoprenoid-binding protein YceI